MARVPVTPEPVSDVLGLGCVAIDDLLYVESYPPPDIKIPILRHDRQCGGLTATALVAASRLGSACAYAGVLGDDELSDYAIQRLKQERVDLTHLVRRPEVRPVHSVIVVDTTRQTRTIFYDLYGVVGADAAWPPAAVIRSTRVLFVDYVGMEGMLRASQIAREAGIPVVADLEDDRSPFFARLFGLIDHLIVSRDFAARLTGASDPAAAAIRLWTPERRVVAVTCGADGCWYLTRAHHGVPQHQPAYPVETVDTTGCGDVFHGAYASALARGVEVAERVRFASAAAALKATQPGGQAGIPTRPVVEGFLKSVTSDEETP
ncbi:MAG: hypothetical protein HY710_05420 [Candidatus Latescibacteria bacterium]|nr:hypothetical protein [Candidatus Latescibacterota bacterium]